MPATHMLEWRWQQTRVTVRTARSSTQVMLPLQIIGEYKPNVGAGRIEQERNKRQSRSHPTTTGATPASDHQSHRNFGTLVLGCMDSYDSSQVVILQHFYF